MLAHAKLVVGESATVAAESAVLGVPSVYIDYSFLGYVDELEKKYGLIQHYLPDAEGLKHAETFIHAAMQNPNSLKNKEKSQHLLSEKTDVTAFMVWFIENYPGSAERSKVFFE